VNEEIDRRSWWGKWKREGRNGDKEWKQEREKAQQVSEEVDRRRRSRRDVREALFYNTRCVPEICSSRNYDREAR
jgi:hypothetical protein